MIFYAMIFYTMFNFLLNFTKFCNFFTVPEILRMKTSRIKLPGEQLFTKILNFDRVTFNSFLLRILEMLIITFTLSPLNVNNVFLLIKNIRQKLNLVYIYVYTSNF